jgi:HD-GYP domain-containing protein (c-di-GMP phosphodiesterase class II)
MADMLKKVTVQELRLGMHLHSFEAAWIDHPFWRTRFTLQKQSDLDAIRASPVRECWIDVAKGLDTERAATAPAAAATAALASTPPVPRRIPASFDEELARAAALCKRSRQAVMLMFTEARMGHAFNIAACADLVEDLTESVLRNPGALVSLARLKSADDYTYMHSVAVSALMVAVGRTLGLSDDECRQAGLAGLVHDMGKAMIPQTIINKPDKLTPDEYRLMATHPVRGRELLSETQGMAEEALDVVVHHHERIDGKGYPHGLTGDALPMITRMSAVCDVYDAVTSDRPYKAGWDPSEAIARMASWEGHFDSGVFTAFVKTVGIYPTGSIVRLASGRLGVVLEQNASSLTTPVIKVFYSTKAQLRIPPERLDLSRSSDRIVGRESRADWLAQQIDGIWVGELAH